MSDYLCGTDYLEWPPSDTEEWSRPDYLSTSLPSLFPSAFLTVLWCLKSFFDVSPPNSTKLSSGTSTLMLISCVISNEPMASVALQTGDVRVAWRQIHNREWLLSKVQRYWRAFKDSSCLSGTWGLTHRPLYIAPYLSVRMWRRHQHVLVTGTCDSTIGER